MPIETARAEIETIRSHMPHIDGFAPGTASVGATVTITGSAFTGTTDVRFGGTPASFTVTESISREP